MKILQQREQELKLVLAPGLMLRVLHMKTVVLPGLMLSKATDMLIPLMMMKFWMIV